MANFERVAPSPPKNEEVAVGLDVVVDNNPVIESDSEPPRNHEAVELKVLVSDSTTDNEIDGKPEENSLNDAKTNGIPEENSVSQVEPIYDVENAAGMDELVSDSPKDAETNGIPEENSVSQVEPIYDVENAAGMDELVSDSPIDAETNVKPEENSRAEIPPRVEPNLSVSSTFCNDQSNSKKMRRLDSGESSLPAKKQKLEKKIASSSENSPQLLPIKRKPGRRSTLEVVSIDQAIAQMSEHGHRDKLASYVGKNADFSWLFPGRDNWKELVKSFMKVGSLGIIEKAANGAFTDMEEVLMMLLVLRYNSIATSASSSFWRAMLENNCLTHHTESSLLGWWKRAVLAHLDRFENLPNPVRHALKTVATKSNTY